MNVALNVCVPPLNAALVGGVRLASLEEMATVSAAVLTRFQLESTALTVKLNAEPALRVVGAPVLPVAVPGAAVSPGTSSWSLTKPPGLIVIAELVLAVFVPSVI